MFPKIEDSKRLLENLSESFAVEVKRWFDPSDLEGKSKLIKALIAMRNNGGGRLVVGFDNSSMRPVDDGRPQNIRTVFSQDIIQAIVVKYSSEPFEVQVQYVQLAESEFPVVCVPSGVRTPVAARAELKERDAQKPLVQQHSVYVRTLSTNNTVSTASAQWNDWDRLIEICFDNREADIGRFVRRHLGESGIVNLAALLNGANSLVASDDGTLGNNWIDAGRAAYDKAVIRSKLEIPAVGYFEIGAIIHGDLVDGLSSNQRLLSSIAVANRHLTGWPFFAVLQNAEDKGRRPQVVEDAWETSIIRPTGDVWGFNGIDFWRIQPNGKLYAIRGYYEDFNDVTKGKRLIGIVPAIRNVADGIAEALAIAKQLSRSSAEANVAITLRWTDINGRSLSSIFSQRFWAYAGGQAVDDSATATVNIPIDLPDSALAEQVGNAVAPLFRKFQGFEVSQNVVEAEVKTVLNNQY